MKRLLLENRVSVTPLMLCLCFEKKTQDLDSDNDPVLGKSVGSDARIDNLVFSQNSKVKDGLVTLQRTCMNQIEDARENPDPPNNGALIE